MAGSGYFTMTLTEAAGTATTLTDFTVNGVSQASQLNSIFPSNGNPAKGSITGTFGFATLTVPQTMVLGFSGMDAGGLSGRNKFLSYSSAIRLRR